MLKKRIIPCLDMRDGRVVKGIQFENIRDAGDPVETARRYSQLGADEITFLDINATHEGRSTMFDVVERTAEQVFIPFTVGGGIRDIEIIREVLRRGADKISLNSPAVRTPELIEEGAMRFGSQCIVVSIDVKRCKDRDGWDVYINGGMRWNGCMKCKNGARAKSCLPAWMRTAPCRGLTWMCCPRPPKSAKCR